MGIGEQFEFEKTGRILPEQESTPSIALELRKIELVMQALSLRLAKVRELMNKGGK